jgi:hypothetical protein
LPSIPGGREILNKAPDINPVPSPEHASGQWHHTCSAQIDSNLADIAGTSGRGLGAYRMQACFLPQTKAARKLKKYFAEVFHKEGQHKNGYQRQAEAKNVFHGLPLHTAPQRTTEDCS